VLSSNPSANTHTKKRLQQIYLKTFRLDKDFQKVAGYKVNIQTPVAFLYANNELSEKEINPIHNSLKEI
jgi:hypothetical protein